MINLEKAKELIDFKIIVLTVIFLIVLSSFFVFKVCFSISFLSMKEHIAAGIFNSILDIFFLFIIFTLFLNLDEKQREKKRYLEEINDYRYWHEPEATYRIFGNIKRLFNLGITIFNLENCFLKGLKFEFPSLNGSCFIEANLEGAKFEGIDLRNCAFEGAKLQKASFYQSDLENSFFSFAKCSDVDFSWTKLKNVTFEHADITGADFYNADFTEVGWISYEQLTIVKLLFGATNLDPEIEEELKMNFPELFVDPNPGHTSCMGHR